MFIENSLVVSDTAKKQRAPIVTPQSAYADCTTAKRLRVGALYDA